MNLPFEFHVDEDEVRDNQVGDALLGARYR